MINVNFHFNDKFIVNDDVLVNQGNLYKSSQDAHTLKIQGMGYLMLFSKILGKGSMKNSKKVTQFLSFIIFFSKFYFEYVPKGVLFFYPSPTLALVFATMPSTFYSVL